MSNNRRRLTGVVIKAKQPKTITVQVDRSFRHQLYEKVVRSQKNFLVHDEIGCHPGDRVVIVESKPISKRKRFVVEEVLQAATEAEITAGQVGIEPVMEVLEGEETPEDEPEVEE
jgi:small subunit ribosomal protein S17